MIRLRPLAVASLVVYSTWYLLPQAEWRWLSEDALVVISYSGFEAALGYSHWVAWSGFVVVIVAHIGVVWYGARFRIPFLLIIGFFVLVMNPLSGIVVETGLSIAIRDFSNIVLGVLILSLFASQEKNQDSQLSGAN